MIFKKLFGGGAKDEAAEQASEEVEHEGYRISSILMKNGGQYQTAGIIRKTFEDGEKSQRFIRADLHASREGADQHALQKARQIIKEQGDRLFRDGDAPI